MTLANRQKHLGFTIIEMIITVALLAAMVAVAVPGFGTLFQNNRLTEASNRFLSSVTLARSEAINRNSPVIVCNTNALGTGCDNNGFWESGWTVWADLDSDGNIEDPNEAGSFETILQEEALPAGYTLRAGNNQFANSITFSSAGDASGDVANGAEIFRLCDPAADITRARSIHLNGVGRAWVNRNTGAVACP